MKEKKELRSSSIIGNVKPVSKYAQTNLNEGYRRLTCMMIDDD